MGVLLKLSNNVVMIFKLDKLYKKGAKGIYLVTFILCLFSPIQLLNGTE